MSMITVRSDPELDARLEAFVDQLKGEGLPATRSSAIRSILSEHLGSKNSMVLETVRKVHQVLRVAMTRAVEDVRERVPEYVADALASEDGSPHADG
jgi:primosomal protein N''